MISSGLKERSYTRRCEACSGELFLRDPCAKCGGTGIVQQRCRECYTWKDVSEFLSGGKVVRSCSSCRRGVRKSAGRRPVVVKGGLRVSFCSVSRNTKTGPIPTTMTSIDTCPTSCPWQGRGCYAEHHFVGMHWRRLSSGGGVSWEDFLALVRELPRGQLWRHNEAGDLPGEGDVIDRGRLGDLCEASGHARGFTYTHKPVIGEGGVVVSNREAVAMAVCRGFVVNLSADGLLDADAKVDLGIAPVVVTLPERNPRKIVTPGGRRVVVCPAVTVAGMSCSTCALCAKSERKCVVGFPAHGDSRRLLSQRLGPQLGLFDRKEIES